MKLKAEIEDSEGNGLHVSCNADLLTIESVYGAVSVSLTEFRRALDAVAGPVKSPVSQIYVGSPAVIGTGINPHSPGVVATNPYARNPDGSRNGPSPRDNMRARKPTPEANVEMPEEETAA